MKTHTLKTWPAYYEAVRSGAKTFEIRLDDRNFAIGDRLELKQWDRVTQSFINKEVSVCVEITYLLHLKEYLGVKGWGWTIARWLMPNLVVIGFNFVSRDTH